MGPSTEVTALKSIMPRRAFGAGQRGLRLIVVASFALALAACDKCNLPPWPQTFPQGTAPAVPLSCHGDAPVH